MPRTRRANAFLFDPTRYRTDPAVLTMSLAAKGAYSMLFSHGWEMHEPGVFPADDRVLANLATATFEEWASVRSEVALAFDTKSRPGWWVQKGLVQTKEAQDRAIDRRRRAGKASAKSRQAKGLDSSAPTEGKTRTQQRSTGSGSVVGSGTEEPKAPTPDSTPELGLDGSASPNVRRVTATREWSDAFIRFWTAYPHWQRRSHRSPSRIRWFALNPRPAIEQVMAGLAAAARSDDWTREGGRFVPGAEVWIAARGWDASSGTQSVNGASEPTDPYGAAMHTVGKGKTIDD